MNDPNGMFQLGALYHGFFQYNPDAGIQAVHASCWPESTVCIKMCPQLVGAASYAVETASITCFFQYVVRLILDAVQQYGGPQAGVMWCHQILPTGSGFQMLWNQTRHTTEMECSAVVQLLSMGHPSCCTQVSTIAVSFLFQPAALSSVCCAHQAYAYHLYIQLLDCSPHAVVLHDAPPDTAMRYRQIKACCS